MSVAINFSASVSSRHNGAYKSYYYYYYYYYSYNLAADSAARSTTGAIGDFFYFLVLCTIS